jgi:hypothetical protein
MVIALPAVEVYPVLKILDYQERRFLFAQLSVFEPGFPSTPAERFSAFNKIRRLFEQYWGVVHVNAARKVRLAPRMETVYPNSAYL